MNSWAIYPNPLPTGSNLHLSLPDDKGQNVALSVIKVYILWLDYFVVTFRLYFFSKRFVYMKIPYCSRGLPIAFSLLFILANDGFAQQKQTYQDCSVHWNDSLLVLENSRIRRTFSRNQGSLTTHSLEDKQNQQVWQIHNTAPDVTYPGVPATARTSEIRVVQQSANNLVPAHLQVEVTAQYVDFAVKRIFRLYPTCPAIACDFYYQGSVDTTWASAAVHDERQRIITVSEGQPFPIIDHLQLPGRHWKFSGVEFYDATDIHNSLVETDEALGYRRPTFFSGNLLFADDLVHEGGIFLLKEAPAPTAQVAYPGYDFQTSFEEVKVVGAGLDRDDLELTTWKKGYGVVMGVYGAGEREKLSALRTYQKQIRLHLPKRDEMIMMNTWGDRNRDANVGEAFLMKELEAGARLGITYLQIDDGWQQGISKNSASSEGRLWDEWDAASWQPHFERFPNGLAPVVEKAKALGIQLGLWFHPSNANSYSRWETDANIIIELYRQYGIRVFKIDGIELPDKQAEVNLRRFFDKVVAATEGQVVFNVDATAGKRMGYHFMNRYGNIFLENRYTDFGNYYPYWTLRNLWMLSRYVPAENLQIEFLNKWRNADKYPADDPYAPAQLPFDYIFAITMMAQPLAWFEASGLPEEAFSVAPLIQSYQQIQADLHAGQIFPIGEEPSGSSWTGFQSVQDQEGYFLVFRELNQRKKAALSTWLSPNQSVELTAVMGNGKSFTTKTDGEGRLEFQLPAQHSFALYRYVLR